ncbi:hypothetical protein FQA39_LY04818 [Lamprigera yunnana]|nr:hypothetical protein FQA39_LY04818 [Lamprigera yunnana]
MKHVLPSIPHPHGNPPEQYIQEVMKYLRILMQYDKHEHWRNYVDLVEKFINETPSTANEETPLFVIKKILPKRPLNLSQVDDDSFGTIPNQIKDRIQKRLLKQIIRKQNIIQAALLQLLNNVNYLKTKENVKQKLVAVNNSIFPVFDILIKVEENLLQLEQYLENEKQTNDTIQGLSRIGGLNGQNFVKRVTSMVLSNELASHYSWLG